MPLVVMCGYPSSGKTTRANELREFLITSKGKIVSIVDDCFEKGHKNDVFSDTRQEKDLRGSLKSSIQRFEAKEHVTFHARESDLYLGLLTISKENVVILDSANYIKGYRYELFCVTKSAQTPSCVIYCGTPADLTKLWNEGRPESDRYTSEIHNALTMRFEPPDSRNRWDSPLFVVMPEDTLPCGQIYDALYLRKAPPPNLSTQSQPLSATNFLHELDKVTQAIVTVIMDSQKVGMPGDTIVVPGASDKVLLTNHFTLAELQRVRRQFISFTKGHPVEDSSKLNNMFVQFINNTVN